MDSRPSLTLRAFYELWYAPTYLVDARPLTFDEYDQALRLWEQRHSETTLATIDVTTLAAFKAELLTRRGRDRGSSISRHTVNKHLRAINAILTKAGPPGYRNRDALGFLDRAPWVAPCKAPTPRPRPPRQGTLGDIYRACEAATHPQIDGVDAAAWWRALIVTTYNVGIRKSAARALRWDHINWDDCVLRVECGDDKAGVERWKPMHQVVVTHLRAIESARVHVFEWTESEATYYRTWRAIQKHAGVARASYFHLHDLKKACGTELAKVADPWCVKEMLDHSTLRTSAYYVGANDEDLRAAVDRIPQPTAFLPSRSDS